MIPFLWGLFVLENVFILFLNEDESLLFDCIGDEQNEEGTGDILNADELEDDVEVFDEFPYGGEARHAEQEDVGE